MLLTRRLRTSSQFLPWRRSLSLSATSSCTRNNTPLFGHALLQSPEGFEVMANKMEMKAKEIVSRIERGDPSRMTVELVDDLSNEICVAADLAECVRNMHGEEEWAGQAEAAVRRLGYLLESLNTYRPLYDALKNSKITQAASLDEVDMRTLDLLVAEFEQSGIHLKEKQRDKFVTLSADIFDAGARFQESCDGPVEVTKSEKVQFGLDSTVLHTPIAYCVSSEKRKFVYSSYFRPREEQESHLRRLISSRHELALLTGFRSFSHRAQENTLLGSYEAAKDFLQSLIQKLRPLAERELVVLFDVLKQCDQSASSMGEWDLPYLMNLYKERAFGHLPHSTAGRFLSLDNVLRGFDNITRKLYGVRLERRTTVRGEIWPGTILKLVAVDSQNNELGTMYLDVERRTSKVGGDCHYTVRCSKLLESGSWQTPLIVLSLSLADSSPSVSALLSSTLSPHCAENLFHELGHAMHSMLGATKYQHVSGTRCPTDMSEVPSNLMEYFLYDLNVMRETFRTEDGERIGLDAAAILVAGRRAFSGLELLQQTGCALFDLEIHSEEGAEAIASGRSSSSQLYRRIMQSALPSIEMHPNTAYQQRFHHLVTYGAKYYSYLVARAAASLIWHHNFSSDPLNASAGARWAAAQAEGGGVEPRLLLSPLLPSPFSSDLLINSLVKEVEASADLSAVNV